MPAISRNPSELHRAVGKWHKAVEIACHCRDAMCGNSTMARLPGGTWGVYHPDFRQGNLFIEVKAGVGYNLDTLFRIAAAVEKWGDRFLVVCDTRFRDIWERYATEVPRLSPIVPQFKELSERNMAGY